MALRISAGQHSAKGRKPSNQDFHALLVPKEPQLASKGIAIAIADGISSSDVSQEAAQAAVVGFLEDYYCTPEAWSVRTSAQCVVSAINSWLHAQTRQSLHRYDIDKGYVCTFSAVVLKSRTAHVFHVGDARVYRLRDGELEQLTDDHRVWIARSSDDRGLVSRALGINAQVEIDYRAVDMERGDVFVLATDGVHEHVDAPWIAAQIASSNACAEAALDDVAKRIADEAYRRGSNDNLTIQVVRVDDRPSGHADEIHRQVAELPLPQELDSRTELDGYRILRLLHASSRSRAYLAVDPDSSAQVVIKTPSTDVQADATLLERFLTEEWIARRVDNPHVLKAPAQTRRRSHLYAVFEYVEGQTLAQWIRDNPRRDLTAMRNIVRQVATGLQALHRLEMIHQDLRPENVMIDAHGTARIIDFGSTRVAGIEDVASTEHERILGTEQYAAPEYFLGEAGSSRSDIYSLGVIAYQLLSGELPYATDVSKARTWSAQRGLRYRPLRDGIREIPAWVDTAIRRAVHPDPNKRYAELSELVHDLNHPAREHDSGRQPLLERNPVAFWKGVAGILALVLLAQLVWHALLH